MRAACLYSGAVGVYRMGPARRSNCGRVARNLITLSSWLSFVSFVSSWFILSP